MKRNVTLLLIMLISFKAFTQDKSGHYSVSGGILGDMNFVHLYVDGNNPQGLKYDTKTSYGGGIWVNFPLGKVVSVEAQGLYNAYKYHPGYKFGNAFEGTMDYVSVPLFLKFHVAKPFALTAGAQFDFLASMDGSSYVGTIDDFRKSSTSLTAGFELFPHGRVTFFGRYIYGLTNINNTGRPDAYEYYNRNLQLGLKVRIFGGYIAPPPPPAPVTVVPVDTDGDGINDADDKCPNQAGVAKYAGCPIPDTDGDGINDELDKCPAQKGMAKYGGCPIPDTDGDGINDEDDKCPSQSGVARYGGCPIPDTDGDGVNDEEDKCPNRAGPADNFGCPVIGIKSYEIAFRSNKAVLLPNSKLLLDTVVTYLQTNAGVKVTIDGHTDNTGSDKINDPLSVKRAEATKAYLVSKGIDAARMTTAGYGSKRPIADNKTAKGKRKNRRIEIKIQ